MIGPRSESYDLFKFQELIMDHSSILSKLDKKQQELLLYDKANPFPKDWFPAPSSVPSVPAKISSSRPSVKDAIAHQRALKKVPLDRPGSAADIPTPARDISVAVPARYVISWITFMYRFSCRHQPTLN